MKGGEEIKILSTKDIITVCKLIENGRSVRSTSKNCASSRSHAIIEMRLYRKFGDKLRTTQFNFIDLAGSERFPPNAKGGTEWSME